MKTGIIYALGVGTVLSLVLVALMVLNSGTVFLVQKYDPAIGKWRNMEYTHEMQKQFGEIDVRSPSVDTLQSLYEKHGQKDDREFFRAVEKQYPVFGIRLKGVAKRKWSTENPLFYILIAVSLILLASLCLCIAIRRKNKGKQSCLLK